MAKWATYSIVIGLIAIIAPYLFSVLGWDSLIVGKVTPFIAIVAGTLGILVHFYLLIRAQKISGNGVLLLVSILLVIYGLAFQQLLIKNATYFSLAGVLLIALWIALPTKRP